MIGPSDSPQYTAGLCVVPRMKLLNLPPVVVLFSLFFLVFSGHALADEPRDQPTLPYAVADTGQQRSYNNRHEIAYPESGEAYYGQDAQYVGHQLQYRDNGDGTVSDLVTGLMWQADPGKKMTWEQAVANAANCRTGDYDDWRLPTIKELYSLTDFRGTDPDPRSSNTRNQRPFIDTKFFRFRYGDESRGERIIDSQWATSTRYVSTTMGGQPTMFGVNFADGRIKGYPITDPRRRSGKLFYVIYVRGNTAYGKNDFVDNDDGTVTDRATGLMWMKIDSGRLKAGARRDGALNWKEALEWAERLEYAGHDDWRLPNVKELHTLVDYTRSPDTTRSAAIDPIFKTSRIRNEEGEADFPYYWSSTTHASVGSARSAAYIAFGRSPGYMSDRRTGRRQYMDVHGAGSQRSDDKAGDRDDFPISRGPQGDVVRVYNFVRCVRGGVAEPRVQGPTVEMTSERRRGPGGERSSFDGPPDARRPDDRLPPPPPRFGPPPPRQPGPPR